MQWELDFFLPRVAETPEAWRPFEAEPETSSLRRCRPHNWKAEVNFHYKIPEIGRHFPNIVCLCGSLCFAVGTLSFPRLFHLISRRFCLAVSQPHLQTHELNAFPFLTGPPYQSFFSLQFPSDIYAPTMNAAQMGVRRKEGILSLSKASLGVRS